MEGILVSFCGCEFTEFRQLLESYVGGLVKIRAKSKLVCDDSCVAYGFNFRSFVDFGTNSCVIYVSLFA